MPKITYRNARKNMLVYGSSHISYSAFVYVYVSSVYQSQAMLKATLPTSTVFVSICVCCVPIRIFVTV